MKRLIFLLFALLLLPTLSTPVHAQTDSRQDQIVFVSDRDGNPDIYIMNADGSNLQNLTNNNAFNKNPMWSPDGSQIAFVSNRDGAFRIYLMNADGSNLHQLLDLKAQDAFDPVWLPNRKQIAFAILVDWVSSSLGSIDVVDVDGSHLQEVWKDIIITADMRWSPDSSQFLYSTDAGKENLFDIFAISADGSKQRNLTDYPGDDYGAVWSPDGTQIAFSSNRTGKFDIYVMNADGSAIRDLTNTPQDDELFPSWSPDGTLIAYMNMFENENRYDIYVMNADGSNSRRFTDENDNFGPVWSPDGSQILFFTSGADDNDEIFVINADGSDLHNLTQNPARDSSPQWRPTAP